MILPVFSVRRRHSSLCIQEHTGNEGFSCRRMFVPRLVRPAPVVASVQLHPTAQIVAYVQRVASAQLLILCAVWPRLQSEAPAQPEQATEQAEAHRSSQAPPEQATEQVEASSEQPVHLTMVPKHRHQ